MPADIRTLYQALWDAPFPKLGKVVGDFALYDTLLSGYASRASKGEIVLASKVPQPDEESARYARMVREKEAPTDDEASFLEYFDLLEQIQIALLAVDAS